MPIFSTCIKFSMFINLALTFYLQAYSLGFIMESLRISCQLFLYHTIFTFNLSIHDLTRRSTGQPWVSNRDACLSIHDLTRRSTISERQPLLYVDLSIHDLTRRSTMNLFSICCGIISFNSRPHKEVDSTLSQQSAPAQAFQFTTSQGGRHHLLFSIKITANLSIHDLTRRSTGLWGYWLSLWSLSIHDLTRRSTCRECICSCSAFSFNSRPHKEVDLTS